MKWLHLMIIVLVTVGALSATTINVPGDAATIQAAIDMAVDGDSVLVGSGTYIENLNFNGNNIVVYSVDGAESTIIDGGGLGAVVTFMSQEEDAVLDGFTITNGRGILNDDNHFIGGGILCRYQSSPTLRNLIVEGNFCTGDTSMGGGIMCSYQSDALIEDVIIRDNAADYGGGFMAYQSNPTLRRVEVYENNGRTTGGGIALWDSSAYLEGVLVHHNRATYLGAGVWLHDHATPLLNKVTIADNVCTGPAYLTGGGGIILSDGTDVKLVNSIIWSNLPNQIEFYAGLGYYDSELTVDYTDIEGGFLNIELNGSGTVNFGDYNIDEDPQFEEDYGLNFASPCLDAGTPLWEVNGQTILDMTQEDYCGSCPDMGACEMPLPPVTYYVPGDFPTIQAAIDAALDGDTVLVGDGTYYENIDFLGKNIGVVSENGALVTTIDGSGLHSTVTINNQEATSILDGFTITNGIGFENQQGHRVGGGIAVRYSSTPTLRNLIIKGNHAIGDTSMGGGIICAYGADATLEDIIIRDNSADYGGGFMIYESNPILTRMKIHHNEALTTGGGLSFWDSEAQVQEVAIYKNQAKYLGAGVWIHEGGNPTLDRVTIADNTLHDLASWGGAGIELSYGANLTLVSSIVWFNAHVDGFGRKTYNQIEFYHMGIDNEITILYSDIQGGEGDIVTNDNGTINWSETNITDGPMFVDPEMDDYNLQLGSPCIGAGMSDVDMGAGNYCMALDVETDIAPLPLQFELGQNYPNPFNPATSFNFELPEAGWVTLVVYDITGREVAYLMNAQGLEGRHSIDWRAVNEQGAPLGSGIYLYEMRFTDGSGFVHRDVKKFTLLK